MLRKPGSLQHLLAAALCACAAGGGALWAQPSQTDVRRALSRLEEGDWIERWGAMQVLAEAKAAEAIVPLRRLQADERQNAWLRGRALVALAEIQPSAALPLALRLAEQTQDRASQAAAVEALGVIGLPRGESTLIKVLQTDVAEVQNPAVEAYARVAGVDAMPFVEAALRSKDAEAVRYAVRGLSYIDTPEARERLRNLIEGEDEAAALEAVEAAARLQLPQAIPSLLRAAANQDRARVASAAEGALTAYPADVLAEPLVAVLREGDAGTRQATMRVLASRPAPAAVQAVADLAVNSELQPDTLIEAMQLVGGIDAERFREVFAAHVDHESAEVRRTAAREVAGAGGNLFALLQPLTTDADSGVRAEAVQTLRRTDAQTPAEGIIAYLTPALQQAEPEKASALLALAASRIDAREREAAIEVLTPFLKYGKTRDEAMAALKRILLNESPAHVASARGYIPRWRMVGPFGTTETVGERMEQRLPPQVSPEAASFTDGDRELTWVVVDRVTLSGAIEPDRVPAIVDDQTVGGVVVGTATVTVPDATPAALVLHSRGPAAIYVNGDHVAHLEQRDGVRVDIQLVKGPNRLLIKVGGAVDQWGFSVALRDGDDNTLPGVEVTAP